MIGRLFSSLSTHLWTQRSASPNPMQPRQIRETFMPVFPKRVYSMLFSFQMFSRSRGPKTMPGFLLRAYSGSIFFMPDRLKV